MRFVGAVSLERGWLTTTDLIGHGLNACFSSQQFLAIRLCFEPTRGWPGCHGDREPQICQGAPAPISWTEQGTNGFLVRRMAEGAGMISRKGIIPQP